LIFFKFYYYFIFKIYLLLPLVQRMTEIAEIHANADIKQHGVLPTSWKVKYLGQVQKQAIKTFSRVITVADVQTDNIADFFNAIKCEYVHIIIYCFITFNHLHWPQFISFEFEIIKRGYSFYTPKNIKINVFRLSRLTMANDMNSEQLLDEEHYMVEMSCLTSSENLSAVDKAMGQLADNLSSYVAFYIIIIISTNIAQPMLFSIVIMSKENIGKK